jgi:hypothetical protein
MAHLKQAPALLAAGRDLVQRAITQRLVDALAANPLPLWIGGDHDPPDRLLVPAAHVGEPSIARHRDASIAVDPERIAAQRDLRHAPRSPIDTKDLRPDRGQA